MHPDAYSPLMLTDARTDAERGESSRTRHDDLASAAILRVLRLEVAVADLAAAAPHQLAGVRAALGTARSSQALLDAHRRAAHAEQLLQAHATATLQGLHQFRAVAAEYALAVREARELLVAAGR